MAPHYTQQGGENMSFEKAQQFVARMREDQDFRKAVKSTSDMKALKEYLRKTGYDFTEHDLMRAMASCMEEMER
jgi:predicted ribosomally synthesized peptide with nif11-like leader